MVEIPTMGIRGLCGYIKWKLANVRKTPQLQTYTGRRIGIDISCLLYRARGASMLPITVLASLIVRLRRHQIDPVFIFDGRAPANKSDIIDQRRIQRQAVHTEMKSIQQDMSAEGVTEEEKYAMERRHAELQKKAPSVSNSDKDAVKKFLYSAGVLFVTASGEADDVLSYLCRTGYLHAVLSTDMDMLARGVPLLLVPETSDTSVLTELRLSDILAGMQLTYPQFVEACMWMGSDYSGEGWTSVEPKRAIEMAKRHMPLTEPMRRCMELMMGTGVCWEEILGEKQRLKWEGGVPACEPDAIGVLAAANGWPVEWIRLLSNHV